MKPETRGINEGSANKNRPVFQIILSLLKNKWIRIVLLVAAIIFTAIYLASQLDNLQMLIKGKTISIPLLLLSTLFILVAVIVGILTWYLILSGFGYELSWVRSARIQLFSVLAKYVPGIVWQFSGKAYLTHEAGVPVAIAVSAMAMEVVASIVSGAGIALLLSARLGLTEISLASSVIKLMQFIGLVLIVLVFLAPFYLKRMVKNQFKKHQKKSHPYFWSFAVATMFIGWGLLAFAFYFSAKAFDFTKIDLITALFTICGSYVSGILAIFIPNGLLVREVVMMTLLPESVSPAAGLLLSLVARLQVVTCELLASGAFLPGIVRAGRRLKITNEK
ncbi:MAG: flippase-like domain-containing protein [Anaerolineaceae bacterium]|nr:flippase-like domain-containing protein [Anaerolineaceae bacterium]